VRLALWVVAAVIFTGCSQRITVPGPGVSYQNQRLLYKGKRFSGMAETRFESIGTVRLTPYRNGLPDGTEREHFASGQLSAERQFLKGRKIGVHRGWFENGARRFQHEYSDDAFDGEYWEWYPSGGVSTFARYRAGQAIGRKMWREDGTIYMNYVFPGGQAFGLPGAKLCNQVRAD
jgi:antitoxin component YwqK of YwqJK toxin-antitoxin module